MKKFLISTAALTVLMAGPAFAQTAKNGENVLNDARYQQPANNTAAPVQEQAPAPAIAPAPEHHSEATPVTDVEPASGGERAAFNGFYIGADGGYNFGGGDIDADGWEGGLFIGYGWQPELSWWPNAYLGLEAGYDWSEADGSVAGTTIDENSHWDVTVRPGFVVGNSGLAYGIAGYRSANFESDASGGDGDLDGYVVGLGAQFNTGTPLKVRLEYTYADYGSDDIGGADVDASDNDVRLGLVYQFQ